MVLHGNTDDRIVLGVESGIKVLDLVYGIADHFARQNYRIALYAPSQGLKELCPAEGVSKTVPGANGVTDQGGLMNVIGRLLRDVTDKWVVIVLHPEALAPRSHDGNPGQGHHLAEFFHRHRQGPSHSQQLLPPADGLLFWAPSKADNELPWITK